MSQSNQAKQPSGRPPKLERRSSDLSAAPFELPESFIFQVSLVAPLQPYDLPIQMVFFSTIKNDVATLPKLTDNDGKVVFTRQEIIDTALTLQRLFPQDYGSLARGSTGQALAIAMGARDLDWVAKAYALHKNKQAAYPSDFAEVLTKGQARLQQLEGIQAQIQLLSNPGQYQVATRSDICFEPKPSYEEQHYLFATEGKIKTKALIQGKRL